ncbi:MAG TPA: hypothetical protein EYN06_05525 [Myxococcales bacterium]|nr:hypothetical protein [Myxococcales bacterium]HIN85924.1 hypothetical protein [Myxococcales bacterium]
MKLIPPLDLTIPNPDSTTTYDLLSKYLSTQFQLLTKLPGKLSLVSPGVDLTQMEAQVRALAADAPGSLFSVLRRPTVGGPLRCLNNQLNGSEKRIRELVALLASHLYFELALDGVAVQSGMITDPPLALISLGSRCTLELESDTQRIEFVDSCLVAHGASQSRKYDLSELKAGNKHHEIRDSLLLSLIDNNPQSALEAHPEKSGNAVDLGEKSVDQWLGSLREALTLVERFLPELDQEITLLAHQIVPVGYHDERHMSASYQEVIGNIYMTLHPDPLTLAEAIVHEFSHNKVNLLFSLDAVLENAFYPLYSSPVRPDPRPLHGVLLAVHAFLPVERMYERMILAEHSLCEHPRFIARRQQVRANNQAATETVMANGIATPVGQGVLDEISRWNAYFALGGSKSGASCSR